MNDIGTSLTVPGLIATILSVLFAIAALYVSHRRRVQPGGHDAAPGAPVQTTSRITPTRPQKPAPPHVPLDPEPRPPMRSAFATTETMPAAGQTPVFKRLGTRGVEESRPAEKDDSQYAWE